MNLSLAPTLAAVLFGLASAASWGAGDFSGGLASRQNNVFGVVIVSQICGTTLFILLALLRVEPLPSSADVFWGAAAGLVGSLGLVAFYRALATGQMGLTAPTSAVVTAMLPVLFAVFTQGLPHILQGVGFGLALGGVWLLARPEKAAAPQAGIRLALFAGLGFGGFLILIGQTNPGSVFWPLVIARLTSLTFLLLITLRTQRHWLPGRANLPLIATAGVLDAGGNMFYVLAVQAGRHDVAAVLSSLYPASTVLLASTLLRERVTRSQGIGMVAALLAIVLITAG